MAGPSDTPGSPLESLFSGFNPHVAASRDQIDKTQQSLTGIEKSISHTSTDAPYIKDIEQWAGKTHEDIYRGAQAMQPGIIQNQAKAWADIAGALGGCIFGLTLSVQSASFRWFSSPFSGRP